MKNGTKINEKDWRQPEEWHTIVFRTIFALVKSVAVHSIKTFFVFKEIAECAPLIIGGNDNTLLIDHSETGN